MKRLAIVLWCGLLAGSLLLSDCREPVGAPTPRSPHWPAVRKAFLAEHPCCAACGGKEQVEPHHVLPFHERPDLELSVGNLIPLCSKPGRECHFRFGHNLNFAHSNPRVREEAAAEYRRLRR